MNQNNLNHFLPSRTFNLLFLIYWVISLIIIFFTMQGEVFLFVNQNSMVSLDLPMKFISYFGNGLFALFLSFCMLFLQVNKGIYLMTTLIIVGFLTNLLKRIVFLQHFRPLWYYYFDDFERFISIAPINYFRTFPSGHTMTAFAMAAIFSVLLKNKYLEIIVFIFAVTISLARIYLCQHFFIDTFWGALLGVFAAILGTIVTNKLIELDKNGFMNMPLVKTIKLLKKPKFI